MNMNNMKNYEVPAMEVLELVVESAVLAASSENSEPVWGDE